MAPFLLYSRVLSDDLARAFLCVFLVHRYQQSRTGTQILLKLKGPETIYLSKSEMQDSRKKGSPSGQG
jgi:hypothetical protein